MIGKRARIWILLLLALVTTVSLSQTPKVHASQTSVSTLSPTPGTSTESCQIIDVIYLPSGSLSTSEKNEKFCIGLQATVWKDNDERDSSHDFWGASMQVVSPNGTSTSVNNPPYAWATSIYPLNGYTIQFPSFAGYANSDPQSGTTNSQTSIILTFSFISVPLLLPAQTIQASINQGSTTTSYDWQVTESNPIGPAVTSVFGNHADFGAIVSVPEGASFTVLFGARVTITSQCSTTLSGYCDWGFNVSGSLAASYPDFSLFGPNSVSAAPCQTTSATLTATSQSDFVDTVYLSDKPPSGFTTSFSATSLQIGGGSSLSSTYSITWPCNATGTYSWFVNATTVAGTNLKHSWVITNSPDFSISASPTFIGNIQTPGCYGVSTITLTSLGYAGTVQLSTEPTYKGPEFFAELNSYSATLANGASTTVSLSLWASYTYVVWGYTYSFYVGGTTSTGLSHTTVVQATFAQTGGTSSNIVCTGTGGGGGIKQQ